MSRPTLLVRGGTLFTPEGEKQGDLLVEGESISFVGDAAGAGKLDAEQVIDATGLHVLPGCIDSQVHFREPGFPQKEDIGSGSECAAVGGVTTFFEMPNTSPATDSPERHAWKVARAKATSWVDFAFYLGATTENAAQLGDWEKLEGCCGVKCFLGSSTGTLLVDDPKVLDTVLRHGTRPVACHSEYEPRLKARKGLAEGQPVSFHPVWRDEECAVESTVRLLAQAKAANRRVHVLHVSTAGELPLLAAHKGLASCEVTPQHLTLVAPECYERLGTLAQMNPPIRDARHFDALWKGVTDGLFDVMGSDHAPHTREEKAKPYPASPSGMPGTQTMLPLMLDHASKGRLSYARVVDLLCHGPARIFGLHRKGRLEPGRDADLVLVDLKRKQRIEKSWLRSRVGWSPFEGVEVTGWPVMTVLRGEVISRDGALLGKSHGKPVTFA